MDGTVNELGEGRTIGEQDAPPVPFAGEPYPVKQPVHGLIGGLFVYVPACHVVCAAHGFHEVRPGQEVQDSR